jgi:hypothetical protein
MVFNIKIWFKSTNADNLENLQLSNLKFYDSNDNEITVQSWNKPSQNPDGSNNIIIANFTNGSTGQYEGANNLFDNNQNTKLFSSNLGTLEIILNTNPTSYTFQTANDSDSYGRVPDEWIIYNSYNNSTIEDHIGELFYTQGTDENYKILPDSGKFQISNFNVSSFTTNTLSGKYYIGKNITITANTTRPVRNSNSITIVLNNENNTNVVLTSPGDSSPMVGTYTISKGDLSSSLAVSSFTINSVKDSANESMFDTTVPTGSNMFSNKTIEIYGFAIASACFLKDTIIKTDSGNMKIQDIQEDKHTINGKKVKALTKTLYAIKGDHTPPVLLCIPKHALFKNCPDKDTFVSPLHHIFYYGKFMQAKDFIPLEKAKPIMYNYKDQVYDILLNTHEKMIANNMIVETLDPHSILGNYYKHFVLNTNISKKELELATSILSDYNNFYWKHFKSINKENQETVIHCEKKIIKKFLLTCKTSDKKKIFKSLL